MGRRGAALLAGALIAKRRSRNRSNSKSSFSSSSSSSSSSSDDERRGSFVKKAAITGAVISASRRRRKNGDSGIKLDSAFESSSDSSDSDHDEPQVYCMREKLLLSVGNDFRINKLSRKSRRGLGRPAFIANNKVLRMRETFELQTMSRKTLYQIQERKLRIRDTMFIENRDGDKVAEITKKALGIVRDRYIVRIRGEENWQINGSVLGHDFTITERGRVVVRVHKAFITPIADKYYIDISKGVDTGLALCVVIALESMSDD